MFGHHFHETGEMTADYLDLGAWCPSLNLVAKEQSGEDAACTQPGNAKGERMRARIPTQQMNLQIVQGNKALINAVFVYRLQRHDGTQDHANAHAEVVY